MDLMAETLRLGGTHGAANHMSGAQSKGVFHEEQPKEEEEEEEDDEEVSDNPLPVWMEGDSLAPPCQVGAWHTRISYCYIFKYLFSLHCCFLLPQEDRAVFAAGTPVGRVLVPAPLPLSVRL